jgi:dihydroorotate dehydrogenase electron transfer subunit
MNYLQGLYKIEMKREIADGVFDMYINAPQLTDAKAGQFLHIKPDGLPLRRPMAICETIPEQGLIRIVFEVKGSGTKELSELEKGDKIDILGPLGNGFELLPKLKKAL